MLLILGKLNCLKTNIMKKLLLVLILYSLVSFGQNYRNVLGKISFVSIGENYKINYVRLGEDLEVKFVSGNNFKEGQWRETSVCKRSF